MCPKSIIDLRNQIFGDCGSFTVKQLQRDVIGDFIPRYLSKATDIGETSP
jgi:hypothetical protein